MCVVSKRINSRVVSLKERELTQNFVECQDIMLD